MTDNNKPKSLGRRYLGDILVEEGLIDEKTLDNALIVGKAEGKKVGRVLMDLGLVDDIHIAKALAKYAGISSCR